ncbi:MAG: hypothetical protein MH825_14340 [Cyanobacteria bacterium]|nr:hypothetical protein [Cyanobacteriota bacterium]
MGDRWRRGMGGQGWAWASGAIAAFYGLLGLIGGFSRPYLIQDDARQHVFWMGRYLDPALFPNDAIADYFQAIAPPIYGAIYQSLATLGIDPLLAAKLLPVFLGFAATAYAYRLTVALLPLPIAGFVAALLANQSLWLEDDLISGTPRAFAEVLLLMFADGLVRRRPWPCWIAIALVGGIYPQAMLLAGLAAVLGLVRWHWQPGRWRWRGDRAAQTIAWGCSAIAVAWVVLLRGQGGAALAAAGFGPALTAAEARTLPEFGYVLGEPGRSLFFDPNPLLFWLLSPRSGLLFTGVINPLALTAIALPLWLRRRDQATGSPEATDPILAQISPQIRLLSHFLASALLLWTAAHLLLFRLHLPARYTHYILLLVLIPGGAIAMTVLGGKLWRWWQQPHTLWQRRAAIALALAIAIPLIVIPALPSMVIPSHLQVPGRLEQTYAFLRQQPKTALVASLSKESDAIPTFARRSVLLGREFAVPYHRGYGNLMRQRIEDTIAAHYTADPNQLRAYLTKYSIDYLLVEPWILTAEQLEKQQWLHHYPAAVEPALANLRAGQIPALNGFIIPCKILEERDRYLLDARCIQTGQPPQQPQQPQG